LARRQVADRGAPAFRALPYQEASTPDRVQASQIGAPSSLAIVDRVIDALAEPAVIGRVRSGSPRIAALGSPTLLLLPYSGRLQRTF